MSRRWQQGAVTDRPGAWYPNRQHPPATVGCLQVPPDQVCPVAHLRSGIITAADGKPVTLVGFTVTGQKITAIDLIDNPRRIAEANLAILG